MGLGRRLGRICRTHNGRFESRCSRRRNRVGDDGTATPLWWAPVSTEKLPRSSVMFGDHKSHHHWLSAWLAPQRPTWSMEGPSPPPGTKGFSVVHIRGGVEWTNAGNGRSRRNSHDDERTTASSAARIQGSAIHRMLNHLAPAQKPATVPDHAAPSDFRRQCGFKENWLFGSPLRLTARERGAGFRCPTSR